MAGIRAEVKRSGGKLRVTLFGSTPVRGGRSAQRPERILFTAGKVNATAADEREARAALATLGIREDGDGATASV